MAVKVIGLDTAKHVFQVHGADKTGRAVLKKRLKRSQVSDFFGSIPQCIVGLEATRGGALLGACDRVFRTPGAFDRSPVCKTFS